MTEETPVLVSSVEIDDIDEKRDNELLVPVDLKQGRSVEFKDVKFVSSDPDGREKVVEQIRRKKLPRVVCETWYANKDKRRIEEDGEERMKLQTAVAKLAFDGSDVIVPLKYASAYVPIADIFLGFDGYNVDLHSVRLDPVCRECAQDESFYDGLGLTPQQRELIQKTNDFLVTNVPNEEEETTPPDVEEAKKKRELKWKLHGDVPVTIDPDELVTLRCEDCLEDLGVILEVSPPAGTILSFNQTGVWQDTDEVLELQIGPVSDLVMPPIGAGIGGIAKLLSKGFSKILRRGGKTAAKAGKKAGKGLRKAGTKTKKGVKKAAKSKTAKSIKSGTGEVVKATALTAATTAAAVGTTEAIKGVSGALQKKAAPAEEEEPEDFEAAFDDEEEEEVDDTGEQSAIGSHIMTVKAW